MSAISSITGNNPLISRTADNQPSTPSAPQIQTGDSNPFAEVSSEEWLNIILEELSNQDPFEPNDTSATLEQLNSLRSIESDISLQDQLQSLVLQNSIGQAGSLIGREVEGLSNSGLNVTGIVSSVRVVDGESQLQLESGSTIDFGNITNVSAVEQAAAGPVATNGTGANAAADPNVQAINDALAGLLNGGAAGTTNPEDEEAEAAL
ncbi:MAG: flagellar hook capping FlgD N-terminal domain-containing protein [Planctomycetota bacterium]